MTPTIRLADDQDRDRLLELAARAWEPVFPAVNEILGPELARRLHGNDWHAYHAAELRDILASEATVTWVSEIDGRIVGFGAARVVDPERRIGEVRIVGVDPTAQRMGVGAALTRHAEAWLKAQGMAIVFIGTGGDPGHEPARALYQALGYRPFPVVQFYKALLDEEAPVSDPSRPRLDDLVRDATATGVVSSAAIFLVAPGSATLELAAAAGIDGPALEGLVGAVRDPRHPVARAVTDDGPTFDVLPMNAGGPRLRSHLPLAIQVDGNRVVVGVLAVAHDAALGGEGRRRLIDLATAAADIVNP